MDYQEALEFLKDLTKFGFNFGLDRIKTLLNFLGNPEQNIKAIHIGGTNGKGSVAAMVSSILTADAKKVGTFTSPHLHSYRERIRINGRMISEEEVADLLTEIRPLLEKMVAEGQEHPTEFEVNTAMALLYFSRQHVDLAVIEVGLGGLIDSTNVIHPLVAVITNVAMDHMDYLGNTIEEIARVKAGIIKENTVVVTGAAKPEVIAILQETCNNKGVPLIRVGDGIRYKLRSASLKGQEFDLKTPNSRYTSLRIPLIGKHQVTNAAVAVGVIEGLREQGLSINKQAVAEGLMSAVWPARLEYFSGEPPILIDAAHNYDGADALADALLQYFKDKKLVLVIGMLADKEREKVMKRLASLAEVVVVTKPNSPRAGDWRQLASEAKPYVPQVEIEPGIAKAVNKAIDLAGKDHLVCITGSFYMVAEARQVVLENGYPGRNIF